MICLWIQNDQLHPKMPKKRHALWCWYTTTSKNQTNKQFVCRKVEKFLLLFRDNIWWWGNNRIPQDSIIGEASSKPMGGKFTQNTLMQVQWTTREHLVCVHTFQKNTYSRVRLNQSLTAIFSFCTEILISTAVPVSVNCHF